MQKEFKLSKEIREYNSYFKIDSVEISEFENGIFVDSYKRYKLTRPDAVAILVFNEDTRKITLVKQLRYPIINHTCSRELSYPIIHNISENILEAVAGKIDAGETPKQAAVRELKEEVGYIISEERLSNPIEIFASAGYSSEKIYIFLVVVKNSDRDPNAGGGVAGEHENIEIVEMDLNEFVSKVQSNEIKDSKTIIAANLIKI